MIKNTNNKKKKKGFTLIELIIVIAIIAILAAIAIPKFGDVRRNANVKSDIANAKTIANAVTALIADGKIDVNVASIPVTKESDDDTDSKDIEDYLQNVPTPKSVEADNFVVSIVDGRVTVSAGTGENPVEFFPEFNEE